MRSGSRDRPCAVTGRGTAATSSAPTVSPFGHRARLGTSPCPAGRSPEKWPRAGPRPDAQRAAWRVPGDALAPGVGQDPGTHCRVFGMGSEPRMTLQTLKVLKVLFSDPLGEHYGLEIANQAGLKSGTIYPILVRLEEYKWVTSDWEEIDPVVEGRRPRRYY